MQDSSPLLKKLQWRLRLLGWFKIPMIGFLNPRLLHVDDEAVKLKIRLSRRSKNHLGSMYFGALSVGADVAAGLLVFYFAERLNAKISFVFKGLKAEFLKRAESDVVFECTEGILIMETVLASKESGERKNETINVIAYDSNGDEVARFEMIISVKVK